MSNYRIDRYDDLRASVSLACDRVQDALNKRTAYVNANFQPAHSDVGALILALKLLEDAAWELSLLTTNLDECGGSSYVERDEAGERRLAKNAKGR